MQPRAELRNSSRGNVREWKERCEESSRILDLERDDRGLVPIWQIVVARVDPLSAVLQNRGFLQNIMPLETESVNWPGMVETEDRKPRIVLKLCAERWM